MAVSTAFRSLTSTTAVWMRWPYCLSSSRAASRADWLRSQMERSAPERAIACAHALPIPDAPPVMTATLPSSS